jgi:hypothetical protein
MTDAKNPEQAKGGRRRALKLLLGGGVVGSAATLPTRWTRPVVESVILPAHAQLSGPHSYSGSGTLTPVGAMMGAADPGGLLDLLVPTAAAGTPVPESLNYDICIVVTDGTANVHINVVDSPICTFIGSGAVGGGTIDLPDCGPYSSAACTVMLNADQTEATGSFGAVFGAEGPYAGDYTAPVMAGICMLPTVI